jgi:hypothetical protein
LNRIAQQFHLPTDAVVVIDGVPYALVTRERAGLTLRRLAGGCETVVLCDAVLLDLHRGGRMRMAEPDACGGRR